jgi:hypothetical protein
MLGFAIAQPNRQNGFVGFCYRSTQPTKWLRWVLLSLNPTYKKWLLSETIDFIASSFFLLPSSFFYTTRRNPISYKNWVSYENVKNILVV